jgi:hypothetical protein
MNDGSAFAEVVEAEIEDARALAIDDGNAERGLGSKHGCEWFQLEARLKVNLRRPDMRRQFVLFPEILRGAGENGFAADMAAQVGRYIEHAIKVGVKRSVLAGGSGAFQRLLH